MTISFSHDVSPAGFNLLTIKTNQGLDVSFYFEQQDCLIMDAPDVVHIEGNEFDCSDDTLMNGLFVNIGQEFISLKALAATAAADWPDIHDEIEQEGREAADMARELSSPRLTGRI